MTASARAVLDHFQPNVELTGPEACELIPWCTAAILRDLLALGYLSRRPIGQNQSVYFREVHA